MSMYPTIEWEDGNNRLKEINESLCAISTALHYTNVRLSSINQALVLDKVSDADPAEREIAQLMSKQARLRQEVAITKNSL